jgi:hypothetical protein
MNAYLDSGLQRLIPSQPRLTAIPGLFPFAHFSKLGHSPIQNRRLPETGQYPALQQA